MTVSAREAALRPFGKPGRGWWLLVTALGAVVLAGTVAWIVQLRSGMSVAGYGDGAFWTLYEANLVTFIGVSYGGAVVSAILRLTGADWRSPLTRLAEGTAVVTVLVGTAFIIPHLGRVDRVWRLVTQPNLSAPVFWDFVAVMTYTAASIVFFALPLVPDMASLHEGDTQRLGRRRAHLYAAVSRGWVGAPRQRKVLASALGLVSIMIIPLAVSVHSVLAWAFSLTSPPWWHESIWAPYFVVAALYSGVALVILVVAGFRRGYHLEPFITEQHFVRLGFILATFSATYLYLTFADILPGAYIGEPDTAAVFHEILTGRYAVWLWVPVLAGGVLPLLLVALPWTRNVRGIVLAAALVVPAMWLKRILMVIAPATYDRVTGTFSSYQFTWIAVAVTLAGVAAVPLLLMLLFRVVPLLSLDEMDQGGEAITDSHPDQGEQAVQDVTGGHTTRSAHRVTGAAGVLLLLALLGMTGVVASPPALASRQDGQARGAPSVTITGISGDGLVQLTATLIDQDEAPITDADVDFFLSTTSFGGRLVQLGSVTTDHAGTARLVYQPAVTGPQKFVASYSATEGARPVRGTTTLDVTVARSAHPSSPPRPLAGPGRILIVALFTIVAAVWLTLIALVVRVRRVCRGVHQADVLGT